MNSKERLSEAIRKSNLDEFKKQVMTRRAIEGYYSDYDSPLETPCVQLVNDLKNLGLTELAKRAVDGEFDATKEESDAWYEREGKDVIKEAGLNPEMFQ